MSSSAEPAAAGDPELRGRLLRRYFVAIGGGIGVVLLLAMAVETPFSYSENLARVGDIQAAEVRSAALRVEQFLGHVETTLAESAGIPWSSEPFSSNEVRAEHHRLLKIIPALDSLRVYGADGQIRAAVSRRDLDRPGPAHRDEGLVQAALADGRGVGPVFFRDGTEPVVAVAIRGASRDTVMVGELNLRTVGDIVKELNVGSTGHAFVVDQSDRIVAHRDLAKTIRPASASARAQFEQIRTRLSSRGKVAGPFETRNADDIAVLTSAVALPSWGWIVVAEEPVRAAMAPVRSSLWRLVGLLVAGLAAAFLISRLLARRLSRPILSLRDAVGRIARGELSTRVQVSTGDEVEILGRDLNAMAGQLEEYAGGLERKVEEKTAKLQEAMRARALFLAAASHDLRQPLYAISILADTLSFESIPPQARETLAKQQEAIAVLRGLFDNLLDLSRFDSGEIRVNPRVVSLREILTPIAIEHEVVSRAKGLAWRCEIEDVSVHTDPELVRRITANLLSNAVRYTPMGEVSLVARRFGDIVRLIVSDTGVGIAPEDQGRVFQEFVQLDNPARERDRGVGLGLSIVKKISDLMGANLTLRSVPGQGTVISIEVPAAEQGAAKKAETQPAGPSIGLEGLRVWVVEDDPLVRNALEAQFTAWGVDFAFAVNRAEVDDLRDSDGAWPDAVMLDDMLAHGERGLDIARWLASQMPADRIVMVTGNVEPAAVQALASSGFRNLRKPLSSAVLAQCLQEATRHRAL